MKNQRVSVLIHAVSLEPLKQIAVLVVTEDSFA